MARRFSESMEYQANMQERWTRETNVDAQRFLLFRKVDIGSLSNPLVDIFRNDALVESLVVDIDAKRWNWFARSTFSCLCPPCLWVFIPFLPLCWCCFECNSFAKASNFHLDLRENSLWLTIQNYLCFLMNFEIAIPLDDDVAVEIIPGHSQNWCCNRYDAHEPVLVVKSHGYVCLIFCTSFPYID